VQIGLREIHLPGVVVELAGRRLKVDYCSVWEFVYAERALTSNRAWWLAGTIIPRLGDEPSGVRMMAPPASRR
jgi:hypothetical protein